jgi:hypothetical protein
VALILLVVDGHDFSDHPRSRAGWEVLRRSLCQIGAAEAQIMSKWPDPALNSVVSESQSQRVVGDVLLRGGNVVTS